jgi:tRNA pseudouridine38-40 synthase
MKLRYRATVEYDGTDFFGFQIQAKGRTVQGEIEKAIQQIIQSQVRIIGAGRTDAGVHAAGQVIAFEVSWRHAVDDLQRALNAVLPQDIAVSELKTTDFDFHPRFDAKWRCYRYTVFNQPIRSPLWARYAHHVSEPLDVEMMNLACQHLIGVHDFAAFGKPTQGDSTVREVKGVRWFEAPSEKRKRILAFEITANAFLYRMVRNLVGTLLRVGQGDLSPNEVATILQANDRSAAGPPAPARGLCLVAVEYGD